MGFDNVVAGGGIGLSIVGMTVVFAGLALVQLFITLIPKIFEVHARLRKARTTRPRPAVLVQPGDLDKDLLAAITFVLHAEHARGSMLDHQRITLRPSDEQQQAWTAIGRLRTLARRM